MYEIKCETVGHEDFVIAVGEDYDDAAEIARYEKNADYHDEAGVWTCEACYDDHMRAGMHEAGLYAKELADRQHRQDHEDYIDSILSAADLANDVRKGN